MEETTMQNKRRIIVIIIAILLALIMILAPLLSVIIPESSASMLSDGIAPARTTTPEIDEMRNNRERILAEAAQLEQDIQRMQGMQRDTLREIDALNRQIVLIHEEIEALRNLINAFNDEIYQRLIEIDEAVAQEERIFQQYKERIRAMEEMGSGSFLGVLLGAGSLSDMLSVQRDLRSLIEFDNRMMEDLAAVTQIVIDNKEMLSATQDDLREARDAQHEMQDRLEAQSDILEARMQELNNAEAQMQNDHYRVVQMEQELADEIERELAELAAREAARIAEERRRIEEERLRREEEARRLEAERQQQIAQGQNPPPIPDNALTAGRFHFPLPAYRNVVSSRFGQRIHPITRRQSFHGGIDFPASRGTPVFAAESGTVTHAQWNNAYGWFITIRHGNDSTMYAHLHSMAVRVGDTVSRGQTIGTVGSTGWSTGPHLHFEIRINGTRVDPAQFWPGQLRFR